MLEKPDLSEEKITARLVNEYGIAVSQINFLPIGADPNTAVYRADTEDETTFFVKLRKGNFEEASLTLPEFLSEHGAANIISPVATKTNKLWSNIESFKLILYPFIEGSDGYHIDLSEQNWFEFGKALNNLHNIEIPPSIKNQIQKEMYSPQGRKKVKNALQLVKTNSFSEPTAASLALFLMIKRYEIYDLVEHAENLAARLQTEPPPFTVCHSDAHAGNILIDKNDHLYIVDWDNPILAPKERDLMFPGGAQGFRGHTLIEEEILFYRGYGQTEVNQTALAYYRYERVIQDLAVYCEQLLMSDEGGEDRERSLQYLKANFLQGNTLETAYRSDRAG